MDHTLPILFASMKKNNIPNNQIFVFVNEAENDDIITKDGVTYYNSSDRTYFEWIIPKLILQNNLQSDWWFLLHDTVILGDTFFEKVSAHENNNAKLIMMSSVMSNNMGMVKQEVFDIHRGYFEYELNDLNKNVDALSRKLWVIRHENDYLKIDPSRMVFYNDDRYENMTMQQYIGSNRYVEYFPNIDLYKMKKNNGTKPLEVTI
jgi:hypothetical protein